MSQNTSQHQVVAQAVSVNPPKIEPKTAPFLLASMAGEPSDWSTFFQQAILSFSLNLRLRFSRLVGFFKDDLLVSEKIGELKRSYKDREREFSRVERVSVEFDHLTDSTAFPLAVENAFKELEIRWLFGTTDSVNQEFGVVEKAIKAIARPNSPRESRRQNVNLPQEGNEKPIGSIADLVNRVVEILNQFTSETPQCLAG